MFEVLIFLALIPLALGGVFILGAAVWLLLPIAMLLGGTGLALVMHSDAATKPYYYWPALVAILGFFWLSAEPNGRAMHRVPARRAAAQLALWQSVLGQPERYVQRR